MCYILGFFLEIAHEQVVILVQYYTKMGQSLDLHWARLRNSPHGANAELFPIKVLRILNDKRSYRVNNE